MPTYFELDVTLRDIRPKIWRRLLIPANGTFAALHAAIQRSFGWEDCHMWEFRTPERRGATIAGVPTDDYFGEPTPDAHTIKLSSYFSAERSGVRCIYLYDFGDNWLHDVKLVRVRTEEETFQRRLLAGERSGPLEDSGGTPGYARMVEFRQSGNDPFGGSPDDLADWVGDWDPEAFDLEQVKAAFDR